MSKSLSLRARLTAIILIPLTGVSIVVGAWAYLDAQRNAAERFDRSLMSTALAISRDIAVTGGDALSRETRDLLRDTSGGSVFYHVYAPDGVFVTGYATPPVPPRPDSGSLGQYYDAVYLSEEVRALRLTQLASVDGVSGLFTFTVWQSTGVRDGFVRTRTIPVFGIITTLIGALVIIVWFGIRHGLAPLLSLESAIARRSVDDLSPIKRSIPQEVSGIVTRFNNLLDELSQTMRDKDSFISDASHQLRNPIAGIIALTDAVANAKDQAIARERIEDLRDAVKYIGHLTDSLLTLERLNTGSSKRREQSFDAIGLLRSIAVKTCGTIEESGVTFEAELPDETYILNGDPVMMEQAILNVLNNALLHGGPKFTSLRMVVACDSTMLRIIVQDNGKGIAPEDFERALGRFSQVGPSTGSGLGLPIAAAVMHDHGGQIKLQNIDGEFCVEMTLPAPSNNFIATNR